MTLSYRVRDKKNNKYLNLLGQALTNMGELLLSEDPNSGIYIKANVDDYLIEYCTGYKDVDGKYLYVNDYVEYQLGLKRIRCRIIYDHFSFKLAEIRGGYMDFTQQKYTLIGNYHDSRPD